MAFIGLLAKAVSEGENYKTADLLNDLDTNFDDIVQATKYQFSFTNANLVDGTLTVNHSLGTRYILPIIVRPDGTYEVAYSILEYSTDNQSYLNFGSTIESGTWYGCFVAL